MLGGGNPASIPEMMDYFSKVSGEMLASGELVSAMATTMAHKVKTPLLKA